MDRCLTRTLPLGRNVWKGASLRPPTKVNCNLIPRRNAARLEGDKFVPGVFPWYIAAGFLGAGAALTALFSVTQLSKSEEAAEAKLAVQKALTEPVGDAFTKELVRDVWLNRDPSKETFQKFIDSTEDPAKQQFYIQSALKNIDALYSLLLVEGKTGESKAPSPASSSSSTQTASKDEPVVAQYGFPEKVDYLIIGAGTAANSASQAIKGRDPKAKVLIIGEEPYTPYMRPPLSKNFWFISKDKLAKSLDTNPPFGENKTIFYESDSYYFKPEELNMQPNGGVAVLTNSKVVSLNSDERKVLLADGREIKYEKCLLATGGEPRNLDIFKNASQEIKDKTIVFRHIEDYKKLDELTNTAKNVVVIGGGFLGSELACALGHKSKENGMKVQQVFPEKGNLGMVLPEYLSKWTTNKLKNEGVETIPENVVISAELRDGQVALQLSGGSELLADQVVVAVGLEPNTNLAKSAGLEIDEAHGGILVNSELEARSNLWVAGDAASFYDRKFGRRRIEHHDHATVSGRLAGQNMAGAGIPYKHQSIFWSDIGAEVSFEAIGLIDSKLETYSRFVAPKDSFQQNEIPKEDSYNKGVVFYLKDDHVVGVLTWNVPNKIELGRKILEQNVKVSDNLDEYAKMFDEFPKDKKSEENK